MSWYTVTCTEDCDDGCLKTGLAIKALEWDEDYSPCCGCDSDSECEYCDSNGDKDTKIAALEKRRQLWELASNWRCFNEAYNTNYGHHNYCTFAYAAAKGHLACLSRLYEAGIEWHNDLSVVAKENGHIDCYNYIMNVMTK